MGRGGGESERGTVAYNEAAATKLKGVQYGSSTARVQSELVRRRGSEERGNVPSKEQRDLLRAQFRRRKSRKEHRPR